MFDVYQRVKQSIVSIVAHVSNDTYIVGTGFIVSEKGHVVTSAHNILKNKYVGGSDCCTVHVCFELSRIVKARVVGMDRRADVCVLKLEGNVKTEGFLDFAPSVRMGGKCYIFGCMEDYGIHSFHEGFVERVNFVTDDIIDSIATNIRITKGISGSPILNGSGKIIGISNWFSEKTCGGASTTLLQRVVQGIITTRKDYVKGFFGLRTRPILAQDIIHFDIHFLFNNLHGMIVEKVFPNMESTDKMHKHDIISTIDGIRVGICSHSLEWFMYMKNPGEVVKIGYYKYLASGKDVPCWDHNIRFTTATMLPFPTELDVPVMRTRGRIQLLA
jgi:S1-C subfamily serine protease